MVSAMELASVRGSGPPESILDSLEIPKQQQQDEQRDEHQFRERNAEQETAAVGAMMSNNIVLGIDRHGRAMG